MKYWSDATSFEAHVRSQSEKSSLVGCALDVSAATAQQFSGFSSFSDAEGSEYLFGNNYRLRALLRKRD
jgi:hypothetical protein